MFAAELAIFSSFIVYCLVTQSENDDLPVLAASNDMTDLLHCCCIAIT